MIRQHFYPKSYFNKKSNNPKSKKKDSFLNQYNTDVQNIKDHKYKSKRQINKDQLQQFIEGVATQQNQRKPRILYSSNKTLTQQNLTCQSVDSTRILKSNQNKINHLQQRKTEAQLNFKDLFVKCDKKEITKSKRHSFRIQEIQNIENQSFVMQNGLNGIKGLNGLRNHLTTKTCRKLSSADHITRSFRVSRQSQKKQTNHPSQLIIMSTLQTVQKPPVPSQQIQFSSLNNLNNNLINLNLSKAIKYRQVSHQKRNRKKKIICSSKNYRNCMENREIEHKVRGWEIINDEDVEF